MSLSAKARRAKGIRGEREVRLILEEFNFDVRGLEGGGDHIATKGRVGELLALHVESKWQERLQVHQWWEQCVAETPEGMLPVLAYRRSGEEWKAVVRLKDLLELIS